MAANKPAVKPGAKKAARTETSAAVSALTSPYNTMIPMLNATHVRVFHPTSRKAVHVPTGSDAFLDLMRELHELGLGPRLEREFAEFAQIDPAWATIADNVRRHLDTVADTAGTETAGAAA